MRQGTSDMDERSLHGLLDSALTPEPPIGPVARNSLQAGIKLRRRRRVRGAVGSAAVVAAVAVAIPGVTGALSHIPAAPHTGMSQAASRWATVYVANGRASTVTPIATATNAAGTPITVGEGPGPMAVTPNGKTVYVITNNEVTPITTATDTAGQPIRAGTDPDGIAITPNGKTVYVADIGSNGGASGAGPRPAGAEGRGRRRHGDADLYGNQHARQAHQGRIPAQGDRDYPERQHGLCRESRLYGRRWLGDADQHRDRHSGQTDHGRQRPAGDRDGSERQDRLRPQLRLQRRSEHGDAD
jgi:YVTN family beta-propeller protein